MKITLSVRGKETRVEFKGKTLKQLITAQGLSPEEYVFSRDGQLILEDEPLRDGDVIKLIPVVSGG